MSLRDVKRVLDVMSWFYGQRDLLFRLMDERAEKDLVESFDELDKPEYKVPFFYYKNVSINNKFPGFVYNKCIFDNYYNLCYTFIY